eukprot:m.289075 g.289075  ORF g.289075 m.289075 type:complete len:147 (-) comp15806_c0_seq12:2396-2836(-)
MNEHKLAMYTVQRQVGDSFPKHTSFTHAQRILAKLTPSRPIHTLNPLNRCIFLDMQVYPEMWPEKLTLLKMQIQDAKYRGDEDGRSKLIEQHQAMLEVCRGHQCCADGCGKYLIRPQRCSRCGCAWYCDRTCQRAHWRTHKETCSK